MKSKEEIEQLAEKHYTQITLSQRTAFKLGYTQCQEDMADKKYTLDDIKKAFMSGCASERRFSRRTDELDNYINSLNKQD